MLAPPKLYSDAEVLYPWCDGVSGGVGGEEDAVRRYVRLVTVLVV